MTGDSHRPPTSTRIMPSSETAEVMKDACVRFLDSLTPALRRKANLAFDSPERRRWHYFPREMFERQGASLKEMNSRQGKAAFKLLASGLSYAGYQKVTAIIGLEKTLGEIERLLGESRLVRDPQLYFFCVYGDPAIQKPWSWRAEGHHISLNFTIAGGQWIASNPLFLGANPAEVRSGPQQGLRILSPTAPPDILTRALPQVELAGAEGLPVGSMTSEQRQILALLIHQYIDRLPNELATIELKKLNEAGLEAVHFAWAGAEERGKPHYYRLHGPFFFVEYDNTQNNANHIHTVWRNPQNDFGVDLLHLHYKQQHL
jgi:hypothetical protein